MWTKRYIALPIEIFNQKEEDLTGKKAVGEPVFLNVNPFEIAAYHPTRNDDYPERELTRIELRLGGGYLILLTVKEFEQALNLFTQSTN